MTESSIKHHGVVPDTSSGENCTRPIQNETTLPHPKMVHDHYRSSTNAESSSSNQNSPSSPTSKQDQQGDVKHIEPKLVYYQSKNDTIWDANFQKLILYEKEHQDCLVPQNYACDPPLGRWVHQQRVKLRQNNLSHSRKEKLDSIGFTWSQAKEAWLIMYDRLVDYKAANDNCMVPRAFESDPKLGKWVNNQRHRRHKISQERQHMLTTLGFSWDILSKKSGSSQSRTHVRSSRTVKREAAPKTNMVSTAAVNQAPVPFVSYLEHYQKEQYIPNNTNTNKKKKDNDSDTTPPPQDYGSTFQESSFMAMMESTTAAATAAATATATSIMLMPPGMCKKYERVTATNKTSNFRSCCCYQPDTLDPLNESHPFPTGEDGTEQVPQDYSKTPVFPFSPLPTSKRTTPSDIGELVSRGINKHIFGDIPSSTKRIRTIIGTFQPTENQGRLSGDGSCTAMSTSRPQKSPAKPTGDHALTNSTIIAHQSAS
mmetsp:Transcript_30278/g.46428  ORF Transcript_30278/g.46428 Transcript_30278/m.46428 type:complete len:484 (+) Transcript_30278:127-1578(+)|eukprot:CAMPEP_0195281428 /NCGR_PEP_ID=MMETSP0707-20130614/738_1 /TAXON_ID=33640 /ORGANISM="Asterionellopsis glacialis, Strain CCMP134" /LENGTH=483 /DNA_ID=CAMNT_0040340311 /DNA_START=94 /DNA_END=1545 /DNA_ORIENTATION=-